MTERYDVVVVGARCAGATLAFHLARAGQSVALVDRAHFPSDTLSTHFFQTPGVASLERMGLLDALQATGAPLISTVDYRLGDVAGVGPFGKSDQERQGPGGACAGRCSTRPSCGLPRGRVRRFGPAAG